MTGRWPPTRGETCGRQGGKSVLMKVPSGNGSVSQLKDYNSYFPSVSPDGKWIAWLQASLQRSSVRGKTYAD